MKKLVLVFSCLFMTNIFADTEISNYPVEAQNIAKPNLIFALDDSGSMDSEVNINTNDGAFWFDRNAQTFFNSDGTPLFNESGGTGNNNGAYWYKYTYLFPNGTGSDARTYNDSTTAHYAIPPTQKYAFLRSHQYNPLYYNPNVHYYPWAPAYIDGDVRYFDESAPTAARSHPFYPTSGSPTTMNLTQTYFSKANNYTFRMFGGMVLPGDVIDGIYASTGTPSSNSICGSNGTNNVTNNCWELITGEVIVPDGQTWNVAIPYFPATYYKKDNSCLVDNVECVVAPDGEKLKRYEIRPGLASYPRNRTYEEEIQNFANWFTFYRKRQLMVASAVSIIMPTIQGMRGGVFTFNDRNTVSMKDFSNTDPSQNGRVVLGRFYKNKGGGGTPTRDALKHAGEQFKNNNSIIQHACQVNATIVVTDGFANAYGPSAPDYNQELYGATAPYTTTYNNSLADIALGYYTMNLRTDLTPGRVPVQSYNPSPNADMNPNLHMNTFALTLGTPGTIYGTNSPAFENPFITPPQWPEPNQNRHPSAVDDLWHATINGRGMMFSAQSLSTVVYALRNIVNNVSERSAAAISVSNVYVSANDNVAYATSYTDNFGELKAYPIDLSSGEVQVGSAIWSAKTLLDNQTQGNRKVVSYDGTQGIKFRWGQLPSEMRDMIKTPGQNDGNHVLKYIRGERNKEGKLFRVRAHVLGDIIDAEPVTVKGARSEYSDSDYTAFKYNIASRTPMVYQGANDGMLHAFNAATGEEEWAYIPKLVFPKLNLYTRMNYTHQYYVNSTPTVADVKLSSGWQTMLVGGLRAGGKGIYALNITDPLPGNENAIKNNIVMWEFPNSNTPAEYADKMGLTFGQPIIAKTKATGWVVLVASGYNNTVNSTQTASMFEKGNTSAVGGAGQEQKQLNNSLGSMGMEEHYNLESSSNTAETTQTATSGGADGKGYLFILDAETGDVIRAIPTIGGTLENPAGLAHLAAFTADSKSSQYTDFIYGGDLLGYVWRFDLSGDSAADWHVDKLAKLVDASGMPQPITSKPEIAQTTTERLIFIGTGKLLGMSDLTSARQNTMYALVDDMSDDPYIQNVRSDLKQRIVVNGVNVTGTDIDYRNYKGWYLDYPELGERTNTTPSIAFGMVLFNTNLPSTDVCSSSSFQYMLNYTNGVQLADQYYIDGESPWGRRSQGNTYASKPVLIMLPSGKLVNIVHNSDNSFSSKEVPIPAMPTTKKVAWKEVRK